MFTLKRFLIVLFVALGSLATAQQTMTWKITDPKFDALPNAKASFGTRPGVFGGEYAYRIETPSNWNGDLVMWAHGFRGAGPELKVDNPPIREWLVQNGYAWAASSYSANGWAVRHGSDESKDLAEYFAQTVQKPKRVFIIGASMGGNVITDALEIYPTFYSGALALCGAMTGLELFDYYLSYSLVAEYLTGIQLAPTPTSDPVDFYIKKFFGGLVPALGKPNAYTAKGQQFDSIIKYLSGGDRPFRLEGMSYDLVPNMPNINFYGSLFLSAGLGAGGYNTDKQVTTNEGVQYQIDPGLGLDAAKLNAEIKRVKADPTVRITSGRYWYGIPSGRIITPVMSIHNSGDAFVPMNMQISYRKKVEARGNGDLLVQRVIRRFKHCDFTQAEMTEAFTDLEKWVTSKQKPRGDDVLGDLNKAGLEWTKPLLENDPSSSGK
jgi:pimeloyl-ACP methyl ester carboxylesterase